MAGMHTLKLNQLLTSMRTRLDPAAFQRVVQLVDDVQKGRMHMERSQFLNAVMDAAEPGRRMR